MELARAQHTATVLVGGRVLITGGNWGAATTEVFNPISGSFSSAGSTESVRFMHTATLQTNGTVLIVGGAISIRVGGRPTPISLITVELFDPTTKTFAPTASMTTARFAHTATLLGSGKVLVTGGAHTTVQNGILNFTVLSSAELYQ
jgi:hypothetical protein